MPAPAHGFIHVLLRSVGRAVVDYAGVHLVVLIDPLFLR